MKWFRRTFPRLVSEKWLLVPPAFLFGVAVAHGAMGLIVDRGCGPVLWVHTCRDLAKHHIPQN